MSSKRIEIFRKAYNHFKKASNSLKISLESLAAIATLPLQKKQKKNWPKNKFKMAAKFKMATKT
jgi:hypothetical protein